MGMVSNLTITKGGDGSAWSIYGLPTQVDLSIQIQDLYQSFMLSRINNVHPVDAYNLLSNDQFLNFIAVNAGMPLSCLDMDLRIKTASDLVKSSAEQLPATIESTLREMAANRASGILTGNKF